MSSRHDAVLQQTLGDVQRPLRGVRETVRQVRAGELGTLSLRQAECLDEVLRQCDGLEQLIRQAYPDDADDLDIPAVRRRWVATSDVRRSIESALPQCLPDGTEVLWDGGTDPSHRVFGDPDVLAALMIHLITRSALVSRGRHPVLVRLNHSDDGDCQQWSVIDRGPGLSADQLQQFVESDARDGDSFSQGLMLCRQLAGMHFSPLTIISDANVGTETGLNIPASGPRSVAKAWCEWRLQYRPPSVAPRRTHAIRPQKTSANSVRHITRLDRPRAAQPTSRGTNRVQLNWNDIRPRSPHQVIAGTVTLGATCSKQLATRLDDLFHERLSPFDFVYRIGDRQWVWVFDASIDQMEERWERLNESVRQQVPEARLDWSDPQIIPVDQRRMTSRISDLLVRQTLSSQTDLRHFDHNQVRLGTKPLEPSPVAMARLDEEMLRMGARLRKQTQSLRSHASRMRPKER
ncbi:MULTISPECIES: ATP-binding protein [Crateriforma]|uniref:Histidine kinase-, DNA gyrase B-, and HSP90-like ATPase n=1 Tax=Crateriforma conspicua TaxID=2527996 RepID=A0A5C5Y7D3_9PLAN|nr:MULTISPECIES: hypothetical protein [Crateriforma]TWT70401.1 hypothetical protein Pan14r_27070 [Crateriforma conspicua]